LAGHGRVQWAPSLALSFDADLADFDPSRFHGDWPGALSGALQVEASRDDDAGWRALLTIERLQGRLRGRAVRGQGRLHWGDASAGTDLALALGDSRLRLTGSAGDRLDLTLALAPLHLDDLLPEAAGTLEGR